MRYLFFLLLWCFLGCRSIAQPYKNPLLPIDQRVEDLLSRMTPEEKFRQLFMIPFNPDMDSNRYMSGIFGLQLNTYGLGTHGQVQMLSYGKSGSAAEMAAQINALQRFFVERTRLGIPIIPFDEALHGLVRADATAFPQAIALAATWNTDLMGKLAAAIAKESKSRGIRQILSPVVNIASDVRWGRTEETYGEDPFLVSEMGVAYVKAFEEMGVITTPKHFIANVGEGGRDSYPIHWSELMIRELYLPPFEACLTRGKSRSLMTAYNSYDGKPCTANDWLLGKLLRSEFGFKGFVISDAGGTGGANVLHFTAADYPDASASSVKAGLDVIFQTSLDHDSLFYPPFFDGRLDKKTINDAVARVLKIKFELGLFENPYSDTAFASYWNGHATHRQLAKQAALESLVLLKNKQATLPIGKSVKNIAVIGADAVEARLGGYSGPGVNKVNLLDGIQKFAGEQYNVQYAIGCARTYSEYVSVPSSALSCILHGQQHEGLQGEYYPNISFEGKPLINRVDKQIQFQWTLFGPLPENGNSFYSVRWTGKLKAAESGKFKIGIDGNDGYRLYLDGKLIIDNYIPLSRRTLLADFDFVKGREYDIRIEYHEPVGNAWFRLVWNVGIENSQMQKIDSAKTLVSKSDIAVLVLGIEEGEFQDRALLGLPGMQEELIHHLAATGKPLIVLLVGGSAITMSSWMDKVNAIVQVWYPGEEGGNAIAEMLFGNYNPAGRLPISIPVHEGQLPLVYNHKPSGRGDDYLNLTGQALFPFGFGLSYTSFEYSNMTLSRKSMSKTDSVKVTFKVKNSGKRAGDEVVQLYIRDELSSLAQPVMALKGFMRIHLQPGEERSLSFIIAPAMLSMLNHKLERVVEPGKFSLMIGASSKDIRLKTVLIVDD